MAYKGMKVIDIGQHGLKSSESCLVNLTVSCDKITGFAGAFGETFEAATHNGLVSHVRALQSG